MDNESIERTSKLSLLDSLQLLIFYVVVERSNLVITAPPHDFSKVVFPFVSWNYPPNLLQAVIIGLGLTKRAWWGIPGTD